MFCTNCGAIINDELLDKHSQAGKLYCPSCGVEIELSKESFKTITIDSETPVNFGRPKSLRDKPRRIWF